MPLMKTKDGFKHVSVEEAERMVKNKEAVRSVKKVKKATTKEITEAPADKKMKSPAKKK